jgi:hypothetical protein
LCNFGNGFIHSDVYSMPTYLRKFYLKELIDAKKKESDEYDKARSKNKDPRLRK